MFCDELVHISMYIPAVLISFARVVLVSKVYRGERGTKGEMGKGGGPGNEGRLGEIGARVSVCILIWPQ